MITYEKVVEVLTGNGFSANTVNKKAKANKDTNLHLMKTNGAYIYYCMVSPNNHGWFLKLTIRYHDYEVHTEPNANVELFYHKHSDIDCLKFLDNTLKALSGIYI